MKREERKLTTKQTKKVSFGEYWDRYSTITILALMVAVFGVLRPASFLTGGNLVKVMEQSSITILLALANFSPSCLAASTSASAPSWRCPAR